MYSSDGEQPTGLFFVADKIKHPHVRIALEHAKKYEADAVFFRMFPTGDNRSPLPQIYVYHDTNPSLDKSKYAEIHRRLWNVGIVPLAFIITAAEIKVLNCRREPDIEIISKKPHFLFTPFKKLEKLLIVEQAFVIRGISSGTLWENPVFKNDFALEQTAYYKLLSHLKEFREKLINKEKEVLSETVINRLLVMAILVKYLNDRQDANGNRVFRKGFFSQFSVSNTDDFATLFKELGSCIKLFDHLSEHFNGGIFELTSSERDELGKANLKPIAGFLKGDQTPTGQGLFWPLYSFEDLPVELISNIYEEFLAKKDKESSKGIVYTPPLLVDFLIDQCLPLDPIILNWRILDPACGSGIFLVGAYKRLIHCWRMANDWKTPSLADLQGILRNNLFGFDNKSEAILITAFSLCVALCDELDPLVIWNKLKFDNLRKRNLLDRDFFELVESGEFDNHFDLIIGNPPFESQLTTASAERIEAASTKKRPKTPDNQLALLFIEQSFRLCRNDGTVCLIQPAGPLLYNGNAQSYREYLFNNFEFNCIFDFTALEGTLFTNAKVAAAAIMGRKLGVSIDKILHITFRRTRAAKEKLLFEVDPYDFHWVARDAVSKNPFLWKANLLGGGRLHRILERFANVPTLGEYLEQKRTDEGWQFGEGYNVGCGHHLNAAPNIIDLIKQTPKERKALFKLKTLPKTAPWITGKYDVPPHALTSNGIDWGKVIPCADTFFEGPRTETKAIFTPPHVLLREVVIGKAIPAVFSNKELVFSKQIVGIHAPKRHEIKLKEIVKRLNDSGVYGFLAAVVSGRMLVGKASSILQSDILNLPYPDDVIDIELNHWEKALIEDIFDYLIDFRGKGEKALVLQDVREAELSAFGEMYCRVLNPVYENFRPLEPVRFESFICFPFCYGVAPNIEMPDANDVVPFLKELLHRKVGSRVFANRILRLYDQNVIFMIKPNQKRYWLRSIALRDADETLIDLLAQGY